MVSNSGQSFIGRNRKPRVHITYEDPYDANKLVEIPFVVGVLADLSGNASQVDKPDMNERGFLEFDMDNFERRMQAIRPAVAFRVENKLEEGAGGQLPVSLTFSSIDDFGPAAVAKQVPALAKLLEARTQLSNLLRYMDGKVSAEEALKKLLSDPELMSALKSRAASAPAADTSNDDEEAR
ncbi:type VI secretion system contractile sheath small subunit [Ancylobacter sp. 6x-1]|uniref:Type VI secretion system contractile sheath small subunit n=1 Tax=Ancylobacter crimeensis TaxID=2579147 RepID=A0ABT0D7J9_9HYPH|nr:type VI secretion system contractile sheath small subunit [Ancylobacter crimeensis]MCK0195925.1 type VI secretion system contractile sheath small subunit [Ancylobacter crimeensis]